MQQSKINRAKEILKYLNNQKVTYLDYSAYNEEEHDEKYQKIYIELFNLLIINGIFKRFGIDPENNETIFNFFGNENNHWYVNFYEPDDVSILVQDILNNNLDKYTSNFIKYISNKKEA